MQRAWPRTAPNLDELGQEIADLPNATEVLLTMCSDGVCRPDAGRTIDRHLK